MKRPPRLDPARLRPRDIDGPPAFLDRDPRGPISSPYDVHFHSRLLEFSKRVAQQRCARSVERPNAREIEANSAKARAGPQDRRDRPTEVLEHPRIGRAEPQVSRPRVAGVRALRSGDAFPRTTDPVKEPSEEPDSTEYSDEQRVSHVQPPGGSRMHRTCRRGGQPRCVDTHPSSMAPSGRVRRWPTSGLACEEAGQPGGGQLEVGVRGTATHRRFLAVRPGVAT